MTDGAHVKTCRNTHAINNVMPQPDGNVADVGTFGLRLVKHAISAVKPSSETLTAEKCMLNSQILQDVCDLLEVRPELVNMMSSGFEFNNDAGNNLYQLVAYLANINPPASGDKHWKSVSVFGDCKTMLGITQDEAYRLFHATDWPVYGKMLRELNDTHTLAVTDADKYSLIVRKYISWFIKEYPNVC